MSIGYPTVGGSVLTRPSTSIPASSRASTRAAQRAAERYGFTNVGRTVAPSTIFEPNPFRPPAISYGTPLARPGAVIVPLERAVARTALAQFGRYAVRAIPYIGIAITAYDIYQFGKGIGAGGFTPTADDPYGIHPTQGLWKRHAGPFWYGDPYAWYVGRADGTIWNAPITGQAIAMSQVTTGEAQASHVIGTGVSQISYWYLNQYLHNTFGFDRWAHQGSWVRVSTVGEAENLDGVGGPVPIAQTGIPSWVHPMAHPPGGRANVQPMPYGLIPFADVNPFLSVLEQDQRGNAPPGAPPYVYPGAPASGDMVTTFSPGYPPYSIWRSPDVPRPAEKGVKERKIIHGIVKGSALGLAIGAVTESLDAIHEIWKALPKNRKTGYYELHYRDKKTGEIKTYWKYRHPASVSDKMRDIVAGFEDIDMAKAGSNLVDNAIEDAIYGTIGRVAQKARRKARLGKADVGPKGRGFQHGKWDSDVSRGHKPSQSIADDTFKEWSF